MKNTNEKPAAQPLNVTDLQAAEERTTTQNRALRTHVRAGQLRFKFANG